MADVLNLYKILINQLDQGGANLNDVITWNGSNWAPAPGGGGGGGSGTVTSVGLAMPSIFSVSGSPVTISGTLTASLVSQTANQVFAAPDGAPGAPTFRALVAADIPTISSSGISGLAAIATSGSASDLTTGTLLNARLASSYAAITSLANLATIGTVTTGVWNATVVGTQFGGTGQNFSASSGYIRVTTGVASAVSTIALADIAQGGATAGQSLTWNGTAWGPVDEVGLLFGSGRDGALTFDGTTTVLGIVPSSGVYSVNREIEATNITVSGGTTQLVMQGFALNATGTLDISAATNSNGAIIFRPATALDGGVSAGTGLGAQAAATLTAGTLPVGARGAIGVAGGTGVGTAGAAGPAANAWLVNGVGSGAVLAAGNGTPNAGGAAAAGSTITAPFSASNSNVVLPIPQLFLSPRAQTSVTSAFLGLTGGAAGARGGAGGGDATNSGGGSGGSGSGGGTIMIRARIIARGSLVNPGVIRAIGGKGGNSGPSVAGNTGGGAGSGGGQGGSVFVVCYTRTGSTITNAIEVTGGGGGNGGNGLGTGAGGGGGGAGGPGLAVVWDQAARTITASTVSAVVAGGAASGVTGGTGATATQTRIDL